jgi:hypothetical protein
MAAAALMVALGGCESDTSTRPELDLGTLDVSMFTVIGSSVSAGFSCGGLGGLTQERSFPALMADAMGIGDQFEQPLISDPGIPAQLELAMTPTGQLSLRPRSSQGTPMNAALARPYNNLAVPGTTTYSVVRDDGTDPGTLSELILRGNGTQVDQAILLDPSLVFVWVGISDVLGGVIAGYIKEWETVTTLVWGETALLALFTYLDTRIDADVVVADLPDVTRIPYVTYLTKGRSSPLTDSLGVQTVFPVITNWDGIIRQSTSEDYILLSALDSLATDPTYGQPSSPLIDSHVLDEYEVFDLQTRVIMLNGLIDHYATQYGHTMIDVNDRFEGFAPRRAGSVNQSGPTFNLDGRFTLDGGMTYSLDGVHPSSVGYVLLANHFIDSLNELFEAEIPAISYATTILPPLSRPVRKIPLEQMPRYAAVRDQLMSLYGFDEGK